MLRLAEEASADSAVRFLEGSLTMALQAAWRDLAAFSSLIAVLIMPRSALAIDVMLGGLSMYTAWDGEVLPLQICALESFYAFHGVHHGEFISSIGEQTQQILKIFLCKHVE